MLAHTKKACRDRHEGSNSRKACYIKTLATAWTSAKAETPATRKDDVFNIKDGINVRDNSNIGKDRDISKNKYAREKQKLFGLATIGSTTAA